MSNDKSIGPGSIVTITSCRDGEGLWSTVEGVMVVGGGRMWREGEQAELHVEVVLWRGRRCFSARPVVRADREGRVADGVPIAPVTIQAVHDRASREFRALSPEDKVQRMRDAGIREPEPRPWLLALTGYAGSGKDTVASMLQALNPNVRTAAFADAVRELTGKLYGLPVDRDWWQVHKSDPRGPGIVGDTLSLSETGLERLGLLPQLLAKANATGTLRDLLIHVGMSMRALDPGFWLRMALQRIEALRAEGHPVVVTDLRFANEAGELVAAGARLRRISRPGCGPKGEADLAIDTWWATGDNLTTWAVTYENDGTLDDLAGWVDRLHAGLTDPSRLG